MNKAEAIRILILMIVAGGVFFVGFVAGAIFDASARRAAEERRRRFDDAFEAFPGDPVFVRVEMTDGSIHELKETKEGEWRWIKRK